MSLKAWGVAVGLAAGSVLGQGRGGGWLAREARAAAPASAPAAAVAPAAFVGKVVVSDVMIAPASEFPSEGSRMAALRRFERSTVDGTGGFWRFHFVAFLSEPVPATGTIQVVATDVTDARRRDRVKVFEMSAPPGTTELRVSDFVIEAGMGFEAGHRYELAVVRPDEDDGAAASRAGKQDVCAKGVVTLR